MSNFLQKMPAPGGIGGGQTASVDLPLGLTYERLMIVMNVQSGGSPVDVGAADWGTYVDDIRLMVDGEAKITITAASLAARNAWFGRPAVAGILELYLSQPHMRTPAGEDVTAYGTAGGMANFALEIDVKDGVTVNSLEVYAQQSPSREFGPHLTINRYNVPVGVVGEVEISDLPKRGYLVSDIQFETANISTLEVEANGRITHKTTAQLREVMQRTAGRTPDAARTFLDFLAKNRESGLQVMALQDFRLRTNFTATGNYPFYVTALQGQ